MAEQILSQLEVDALLKGLSNGEIRTEADKRDDGSAGDVKAYDFATHEKPIKSRMPTLEMINEKFCRSIRGTFLNVFRKTVDVVPEGIKIMKYEEFLRNIQVPSSLNMFQLFPLRGQALLALDPNLVFIIVDSYFGGDGRFHTRIEGRDFTNVEQAVIKKVVDLIFKEMTDTWRPIHPVDFKFIRAEMNPQFVNIVGNTEPTIVITFRMEIEAASSKFFMCIPYINVEPIKDKLYGIQRADISDDDNRWSAALLEAFRGVPFTVSSDIGSAAITVSELMGLKAGDVIQLNRKAREPLEVSIDGQPCLLGRPGMVDNNYALQIISQISENGE